MRIVPCILFACFALSTWGADVPVYVVAGQSNAEGVVLNGSLLLEGKGYPDASVLYWAYSNYGDACFSNTTLRTPTISTNVWGPEMRFGKEMAAHLGQTIAIVKCATGGTNLYEDWEKGNTNGYEMYSHLLTIYATATNDLLAAGYTPRLRGFVWVQGETDALHDQGTNYLSNLTTFIENVRSDLGVANLRFGVVRLSRMHYGRTNFVAVRAAQMEISETVNNVYWVDSDSLPVYPNEGVGYSHFSDVGQWGLGLRCFNGMLGKRGAYVLAGNIYRADEGWHDAIE